MAFSTSGAALPPPPGLVTVACSRSCRRAEELLAGVRAEDAVEAAGFEARCAQLLLEAADI
jgi:hypothetical protein